MEEKEKEMIIIKESLEQTKIDKKDLQKLQRELIEQNKEILERHNEIKFQLQQEKNKNLNNNNNFSSLWAPSVTDHMNKHLLSSFYDNHVKPSEEKKEEKFSFFSFNINQNNNNYNNESSQSEDSDW
jgi:hypothetical protein